MPLYSKTGDQGNTGLFNNVRVAKFDLRIEAYGTVDELNAFIGQLRAEAVPPDMDQRLQEIQETLFELGSDLATPGAQAAVALVKEGIGKLEQWIDESEAVLPQLRSFILPGGHREAATCHILRTVARRAERLFWALSEKEGAPLEHGIYLNRLSDLFFSWARLRNHQRGIADITWMPRSAGQ